MGRYELKKPTFYVNSATGISLERLENTNWNQLMTTSGEVLFSKVQAETGDSLIDIAGTIAIRTRFEQKLRISKRQANRLMAKVKSDPAIKWKWGQPVSCVNTIDSLATKEQATAWKNRTANLKNKKSRP